MSFILAGESATVSFSCRRYNALRVSTVWERSDQIAEWVRLTEEKKAAVSGQVVQKLSARGRDGEGRPEGGISAASRELGFGEREVQRAAKIASLSDEAKEASPGLA